MIEKILSKFREIGNIQFSQFSKPLIAVEDAIKIVQEAAKEYGNGWIPVETALPKEEGIYLCTVFHADIYIVWIMRFKNGEFLRPDDVEDLDYEVLAWQKIAPYQKGE